jgi:hypothetical protein
MGEEKDGDKLVVGVDRERFGERTEFEEAEELLLAITSRSFSTMACFSASCMFISVSRSVNPHSFAKYKS